MSLLNCWSIIWFCTSTCGQPASMARGSIYQVEPVAGKVMRRTEDEPSDQVVFVLVVWDQVLKKILFFHRRLMVIKDHLIIWLLLSIKLCFDIIFPSTVQKISSQLHIYRADICTHGMRKMQRQFFIYVFMYSCVLLSHRTTGALYHSFHSIIYRMMSESGSFLFMFIPR